IRLEGTGRNLNLNVRSTYPVSYKTFRLSQPNRYVIDFYGGVLDSTSLNINHPEMGDIRMGQFSLAPAITRVVIPTTLDIGVTPPVNTTGQNFNFALNLPKVGTATKYVQEKVLNYDIGVNNKNGKNTSSVVLYFSGPVQYEWRRLTEGQNRFIVDLKRVVFHENKVSKSVSGNLVERVRISQYAASPVPITRLVFDLKDCVAVNVGSGINDNCLVINISDQIIDPNMTAVRGEGATVGVPFMRGTGKTICIDPGHGGSDSGCLSHAYGHMEKNVTLDVCLKLANILRQRGWTVILTRETDRDVTYAGSSNTEELDARAQVGNRNNTDIFVSVHCNAAANTAAEGTSLHVYKRGDRVLAQSIHPSLLNATGRMDRGIQQDRFYVLVHTNMPAVLVETAFLTNSNEAKLLGTEEYRLRIAQGLADGICKYGDQYLRK
ncbi:N-acetylmuramoyl-L-alanine amidase, partial [bacterium]|nr:N-acetylmuramoyl-L-alanine amidase [bacterium]